MNNCDIKNLMNGNCSVSVNFMCTPQKPFSFRPIVTLKGELLEWQLLIGEKYEGLDFDSLIKGVKPTPGNPVLGKDVIRFHPADVQIDTDWFKAAF
jgi:hypothetical protein